MIGASNEIPIDAFNSLFEMPKAATRLAAVRYFLTFNSLFEMPEKALMLVADSEAAKTFNSLFEMQKQDVRLLGGILLAFNSLFEMLLKRTAFPA